MKKLNYLLILVFFFNSLEPVSAQVITAIDNAGRWKNTTSWDLNRLPANGDTVVIPANISLIVDNSQDYSASTLVIKVFGLLEVKNSGNLFLGVNSTIILPSGGRILAHPGASANERIMIGGVTKFHGDHAEVVGPAFANSSTGSSPNGFANNVLPVKFISFTATKRSTDVLVQWSTAEESNSSHFEIQRSDNGNTWNTAGNITAAGMSSSVKTYSFTDRTPFNGIVYYRIKQVDHDGTANYTSVRTVKNTTSDQQIKIHGNSGSAVVIHFPKEITGNVSIKVVSLSGQLVKQQTFNKPVGQIIVPVTTNAKGLYVVMVNDSQNIAISQKVIL